MNGTATLPAGISIRLRVLEVWGWRSCLYPSLWDGSSSEGFVLAVAGQWGAIPSPCTGCYIHVNVLMVVLTSIPTSRCSKRGFLRTSWPRFEDLQCRSCLQHVNCSKCKCIKFLLNLGIVLYRAPGRGRKLDHVLNEAPQTQVSLLQQVTEACRDF